jgi:regulator of protease activity HflC (stomatin/prohibitin superfamily)
MAIKAVLGIFITLFALAVIGGLGLAVFNRQRGRKTRPGVIVAIIGIIGIAIILPLNAGLVLVQPNEVGVVFRQTAQGDAALLEPLQPGLSWVVPFVDQVVVYDAGQRSVTMASSSEETIGETVHAPVRAISADGQVINLDVTVIYRIDRTQVNEIHRNWRGGFEDGFIIPQTRSEMRNAVSGYGAEEIYSGGRVQLEAQAAEELGTKLNREGFLLTDFLVRDISFSPEFTDAIERKQIAEQDAQQAAFRVQQAQQEAEQARVEARGRSDSVVIAAEGNAQATVIEAEAEAEGLAKINTVLAENPNLIQWQYVNQLGDQVSLMLLPSDSPFLFDLDQLMEQAGMEPASPTPAPQPTAVPAPTEEAPAEGEGDTTP